MTTPAHAQMMARYNRWQNQSLYREAGKLTDAERRLDRGAFFGSIHGTLSHLVFGDSAWMFRFTQDPALKPPATSVAASATAFADWSALKAKRADLDAAISAWADALKSEDFSGDLTWFSGTMNSDVTRPRWQLIAHMFNHQTHHRGQVHCMLTQAGMKPDDTDIPFMP